MRHGGPGLAVPVEDHGARTTDSDRPDVVAGGGRDAGEIRVRPSPLVALRRVRRAGRAADLLRPVNAVPAPYRRERPVREEASALTDGPHVLAGGPGDRAEPIA